MKEVPVDRVVEIIKEVVFKAHRLCVFSSLLLSSLQLSDTHSLCADRVVEIIKEVPNTPLSSYTSILGDV